MTTQEMNQYLRMMYREWGQGNSQPFFDVLSDDVVVKFPVSTKFTLGRDASWERASQGHFFTDF
jgi:hypothetical protein